MVNVVVLLRTCSVFLKNGKNGLKVGDHPGKFEGLGDVGRIVAVTDNRTPQLKLGELLVQHNNDVVRIAVVVVIFCTGYRVEIKIKGRAAMTMRHLRPLFS